jgi:hypothetical protein
VTAWICARLDHLPMKHMHYYAHSQYLCLCGRVYWVPLSNGTVTARADITVRFRGRYEVL